MNIGCLSMYLCLFSFLSAIFCSFQCISILPPWLSLFLFYYFWCYCKQNCFINVFFTLSTVFNVQKYNLFLYVDFVPRNFAEFIIGSNSILWNLYCFLHIRSCHLKTETILLLFNLDVFYFSCSQEKKKGNSLLFTLQHD